MARVSRKSLRQKIRLGLSIKRGLVSAGMASGLAISLMLGMPAISEPGAYETPTVSNSENINFVYDSSDPGYVGYENNSGTGGTARIWHPTYNVGRNATVDYIFLNNHQTTMSIVTSDAISQIYGTIKSSGVGAGTSKVILQNSNGLYFNGATLLNLNSLTVTTNETVNINGRDYRFERTSSNGAPIIFDGNTQIISNMPGIDSDTAFIANAIWMKANSKITNHTGKVQLITADGVTFSYGKNGEIPTIDGNDPSLVASSVDPRNTLGSGLLPTLLGHLLDLNENVIVSEGASIEAKNVAITAKRDFASNGDETIDIKGKIMVDAATVGEDGSIIIYASNEHSDGSEVTVAGAELNAGDEGTVEVASNKVITAETVVEDNGNLEWIDESYYINTFFGRIRIPAGHFEWNENWESTTSVANIIGGKEVILRTDDFSDMSKVIYKPALFSDSTPVVAAPTDLPTIETNKLTATRFEDMSNVINDAELQKIVAIADSAKTIQLGDSYHLAPIQGTTKLDLTGKNLWVHGDDTELIIGDVKNLKIKNGSAEIDVNKAASIQFSADGENLDLDVFNKVTTFNLSAGNTDARINRVHYVKMTSDGNLDLEAGQIGNGFYTEKGGKYADGKNVIDIANGSASINVANGLGDVDGNVKYDGEGTFNLAANDIGGDLDVSSTYGTERGDSGAINVNDIAGKIITHGMKDSKYNGQRFDIDANSANGVDAYGLNTIDIVNHAGEIKANFKSIVNADTANYIQTNWGADVTVNEAADVFANNGSKVTINNKAQDLLARGGAVIDAASAIVDSIETHGTSNVKADIVNYDVKAHNTGQKEGYDYNVEVDQVVGTITAKNQSRVKANSSGAVTAGNVDGTKDDPNVTAYVEVDTVNGDVTTYDYSKVYSPGNTINGQIWAHDHSTVEADRVTGEAHGYDHSTLDLGVAESDIELYNNSTLDVDHAMGYIEAFAGEGETITIDAVTVDKDIITGDAGLEDILYENETTGSYDITVSNSVRDMFANGNTTLDVNDARFFVFNGGQLVIDRLNATAAFASGDSIKVVELNLGSEEGMDSFLGNLINGVGYLQSDSFDFSEADVEAKLLMLARFAREGKDKAFDFSQEGLAQLVQGPEQIEEAEGSIDNLVLGAPDVKEAYRYVFGEEVEEQQQYDVDIIEEENSLVDTHEELGIPGFIVEPLAADSFYYDGDIIAGQDATVDPETGEIIPAQYVDFGNINNNLILLTKGDVDMNVSNVNALTALFPYTLNIEAIDELGINAIIAQYEASLAANSFAAVPWPILTDTELLDYSSIFSMAGSIRMSSVTQPVEFVSYDPNGFFGRGTSVITFGEGEDIQFFEVTGNFTPGAEDGEDGEGFDSRELESQTVAGVVGGLNRQIPEVQNNTIPVDLIPAGAAASIEINEDEEEE